MKPEKKRDKVVVRGMLETVIFDVIDMDPDIYRV